MPQGYRVPIGQDCPLVALNVQDTLKALVQVALSNQLAYRSVHEANLSLPVVDTGA